MSDEEYKPYKHEEVIENDELPQRPNLNKKRRTIEEDSEQS